MQPASVRSRSREDPGRVDGDGSAADRGDLVRPGGVRPLPRSSSAPRPTRCAAEARHLGPSSSSSTSRTASTRSRRSRQITAFVGDYKKVVKQQIDALAALKPPANLKAKMSKLLSTARATLARVVAKPTLLIAGSDPFASVNKQSIALGLTDCAS